MRHVSLFYLLLYPPSNKEVRVGRARTSDRCLTVLIQSATLMMMHHYGPLVLYIFRIVVPLMGFLMVFGWGIKSFFDTFGQLRDKRFLENTPTSTIRGLAMGLVELTGKAEKIKPLLSPFTGKECVHYRYTVEQYRSRGLASDYVVIAQGDSNDCPFWLDDGTGKIMVLPQGVQLNMPINYQFEVALGNPLPDNLVKFMVRNHLQYKGLFGVRQLRFKEWFVAPDQPVCVLGTTKKVDDPISDHKQKLIQRLEAIKHDPRQMRIADADHDGDISSEEWDAVVKKIEWELLEEELKATPHDCPTDICIGQKAGQPFVISYESLTQPSTDLSSQILLNVAGGATVTLATLALLVYLLMILRS